MHIVLIEVLRNRLVTRPSLVVQVPQAFIGGQISIVEIKALGYFKNQCN